MYLVSLHFTMCETVAYAKHTSEIAVTHTLQTTSMPKSSMHLPRRAQANMWSPQIWYFVRISVGFHLPETVAANCVRTCHPKQALADSNGRRGADGEEVTAQATR